MLINRTKGANLTRRKIAKKETEIKIAADPNSDINMNKDYAFTEKSI